MSGAREVAQSAVDHIEELITDMLKGNYPDNEVALGRLLSGSGEIQIQLKITRNPADFLDDDFEGDV